MRIFLENKDSGAKPKSNSNKKRVVKTKGESVKGAQIIEYPDGRKYVGEIKKGKRHGIGTIYYTNGSYYDGEWKKDDIHGEGTMYFTQNTTYCNTELCFLVGILILIIQFFLILT